MKALTTLLFVPILAYADNPDFETVQGGALYLLRLNVETHRAEFDDARDCEHVANILNEAEPGVSWFCSTSVPDVLLECELLDIHALNIDTGTQDKLETLQFSVRLNRGVARTTLPGALSTFRFADSGSVYMLTNDYPYVEGNLISRAVYSISISHNSGKAIVNNFDGEPNGNGRCDSGK